MTGWIVYRVTCTVSKKCYIGLTNKDEPLRWRYHLRDARTKRRDGVFHQAIRKYGADAFQREVLRECADEGEAVATERRLIAQYGTLHPAGYNLSAGGETYKGCNRVKGRPVSEAHREHLRRLAAAMKGKKRSPQAVAKGRAKQMGHAVSEETRRKIGEKQKGRKVPAHRVLAIAAKNRGQKRSVQARANISAGHKAIWSDPIRKAEILSKRAATRAKTGYSHSATMKELYASRPDLRDGVRSHFRSMWADAAGREKIIKSRARKGDGLTWAP